MEFKVIQDVENPILKRREVKFNIEHDGPTPSRKSVIDKIVATMNTLPGLVVVDHMQSEFGKRNTIGYAKIYETIERVREVERSHIIKRNVIPEPEVSEPKAAEEVAEGSAEGSEEAS